MRRPPLPQRDNSAVAMTSMIDVVFLLLIFFAVTGGSGIRELLLPAELSSAGGMESAVAAADETPLSVEIWLKLTIDAASDQLVVEMNGTEYRDLRELKGQLQALAELGPENPVILDVAGNVPLGDLVDIYDTCRAGGFETINFAAKAAVQ
jgi:Biopolymer transport protein